MHVVLVAQQFTPTLNAGTIRWDWLTAELAKLGVEVTVVGAQPAPFDARQPATDRPTPPPGPRLSLFRRAALEMRRSLRPITQSRQLKACDVVIATAPPIPTIWSAAVIARLRGVPFVIDLRDTWPELIDNWREWGTHGRLHAEDRFSVRAGAVGTVMRLIGWAIRAIERQADLVVTTTESYRDHLERLGLRRVITVRNSSGQLWTVPQPADDHDELRVLYLGTVGRAQNLTDAVDALALIGDEVPVKLRVVGSGVHAEHLRRYARERGIRVEFLERVPRVQVRDHYLWADTALVMLRDWQALDMAVPSKLYEAMSFGRHVTAVLSGEGGRIVEEAGCGDVVAAGDVEGLAKLWRRLATHRDQLRGPSTARQWLDTHTDRAVSAKQLHEALAGIIKDHARR